MRRPANLEATSQLQLGAKGVFEGEPFELTGRRCIQGARGQIWNEWTLTFGAPRQPMVLSESWGTFTLFREGPLVSALDAARVGTTLPWLVVEQGTATRLAHWGDVDEGPETYSYVDLSHRGSPEERASITEGEVALGIATNTMALGLTLLATTPSFVPAPDVSIPAGIEQWLEIGDVGLLEGVEYRVLGMVARRVVDNTDDPTRWQDYFMHNARIGIRWLSVADGHWTYAVPIEVGPTGYDTPFLGPFGEKDPLMTPKRFDWAKVEWATGQLPWSVELSEACAIAERGDIVFEHSVCDVSAARTYALSPDAVAKAFHKRSLPRPK